MTPADTMRAAVEALEPCPFCGNDDPRMVRRMDESLWSHDTVEWLHIRCDECDCESVSSEVHDDVIAAWNRRASIPPNTPEDALRRAGAAGPLGDVEVADGVAVDRCSRAAGHHFENGECVYCLAADPAFGVIGTLKGGN